MTRDPLGLKMLPAGVRGQLAMIRSSRFSPGRRYSGDSERTRGAGGGYSSAVGDADEKHKFSR